LKRVFAACSGLSVCALLPAQGFLTTPPGGLTTEGAEHSILFGTWSDMRIQEADDTHSSGKACMITEIAFRMDYRRHSPKTAMGRAWTRITLDMSEPVSYESMSSVFAKNVGPSPTRVFDSKWSWPTREATPPLEPDVWGGVKGQLRFPFTAAWPYSARRSILADYVFMGGTLENNGTWNTQDKGPFYFLDSEIDHTQTRSDSRLFPGNPPRCNDSAMTLTAGAYAYGYADVYGQNSPTTSLRGMMAFYHYSYYTAPAAAVLHAVGTNGQPNGANIGAGCNLLYVDLSRPSVLLSLEALPPDGYSGLIRWVTPWQKSLANLEVWLQGAWSDSQSKSLMLTAATLVTLPNGLPPRYKTLFQAGTSNPTGFGPQTSGLYFPFTRYAIK